MLTATTYKKQLEENLAKYNWLDSLERVFDDADPQVINTLRSELAKRYSLWTGLLNLEHKEIIVFENGLGATVITLAKHFELIHIIFNDDVTASIVAKRLEHNNIKNTLSYTRKNINELKINNSKTLIISDTESYNTRNYTTILNSIHNVKSISSAYIGMLQLQIKNLIKQSKKYNTYYITGEIYNPFSLIQNNVKRDKFGFIKYYAFLFKTFLLKKEAILINDDLNNSIFYKTAREIENRLNGKLNKNIIDEIYFAKPYGVILFLSISRKNYVVRLSYDDFTSRRFEFNMQALQFLQKNHTNLAPNFHMEGHFQDTNYYVEERLSGRNISISELKDPDIFNNIYNISVDKLLEFQLCSLNSVMIDEEILDRLFITPVNDSEKLFSEEHSDFFEMLRSYFKKTFLSKHLNLTISHGDFSVDNIIVSNSCFSGIIDWDYSEFQSAPLIDLLLFICSIQKRLNDSSLITELTDVLLKDNINSTDQQTVNKYCKAMKIGHDHIKPLSILCIIKFMAYRLNMQEDCRQTKYYEQLFSDSLLHIKNTIAAKL